MEATRYSFINIPKKAIIISVVLHAVLSGFFISLPYLADRGINIFPKKKKMESVYQSFIQVDVVGLPDQLVNDKMNPLLPLVENPSTQVKETPKEAPKDPGKDIMAEAQEKAAEAQKKAIAKKEAEAQTLKREKERKKEEKRAMKEALDEARREQALKGLQGKAGKSGRGKIKGNLLSQGTATMGAIGSSKDKYTGVLTESIKQHFNIFSWQQKKGLMAEVKLMLHPNGRVKYRKIVKASNDALYDSAVLQAIDEAQPFPVPEDKTLLEDEITINFKP